MLKSGRSAHRPPSQAGHCRGKRWVTVHPGLGPPGPGLRVLPWEAGLQGIQLSVWGGGCLSGEWRAAGPPAPVAALGVAVGVTLQAHAAALLHLGVAEGAAGPVGTAEGHITQRGSQLLAAAAPVLNRVGFQRVPAGKAAQHQGSRRPSPPQTPAKTCGQPGANDGRRTASSRPQVSEAAWLTCRLGGVNTPRVGKGTHGPSPAPVSHQGLSESGVSGDRKA